MFVAGTFLIDSDTTNEELLERRPQPNTGSQTPLASGSATRESSAPKASSTLPSSSPRAKNEELQKALIGLKKAIESLQEKKVINCDYATALEVFSSSHRELQQAQILLGPGVIHEEVIPVLELCAKIRELRSQPAQKRPVTPADPHKATETEVRASSKGLSNPSCNCFMNASLQALSHSSSIREHLIGQLLALSTKEGLPLNPLRPEAPFACLPTGLTQKDKDRLNAHFRLNLPQLKALADAKIQTTLLPLASFELSELIKLDLSDKQVTSKIYMQASLQQAAGYAHSILSKWHTGTEITREEAILLRVSLIKIMGRPAELKLSETNSFFSFFLGKSINADWEIPGLSGADPDMSILYRKQEGAGEFSRNLLESLDQLTEATNPLATVTQRLKKV
jgi:hypothetical protein